MNIKDIDDVVDVLNGMENKIKHIKTLLKTKDEQILSLNEPRSWKTFFAISHH